MNVEAACELPGDRTSHIQIETERIAGFSHQQKLTCLQGDDLGLQQEDVQVPEENDQWLVEHDADWLAMFLKNTYRST